MFQPYFSNLLPELSTRAARATVSRLGFSNVPLRAHLMETFSKGYGQRGAFLADPVFEATFGWQASDQTMSSLSGGLLNPELIAAMDQPPGGSKSEYRFAQDAKPYVHQIKAWNHLLAQNAQSVVVTSGTGSGKTECFMVPILNRLITEHLQAKTKLIGVRALFLYPLNALIQSQRDRLNAWTSRFGEGVRFCLYNGLTPNKVKQEQRDKSPNEVVDREILRKSPPPMLVTNPTMLEYMLVRSQDAPILELSQGKLQWVVLDEAHTYIGSQAAELALLLRRVLHSFGVQANDVRFIATSATIGGKSAESEQQLQSFISKLAGVSIDRVHVVAGSRSIPGIPDLSAPSTEDGIATLLNSDLQTEQKVYDALCESPIARRIRNLFVPDAAGKAANSLNEIAASLRKGKDEPIGKLHADALTWLDLLTSAKSKVGATKVPFLPLRLHAFHNVLSGLWACSDAKCACKVGTQLDSTDWHYGNVYTEERKHCECGAPVYEMRSCNDCNATFLWARRVLRQTDNTYLLKSFSESTLDEFSLDEERGEEDDVPDEVSLGNEPVLIANGRDAGVAVAHIEKATFVLDPAESGDTVQLRLRDRSQTGDGPRMVCPDCGGNDAIDDRMFRRAFLGAPFLLGEVIPTLLEYCPDGEEPSSRPMRGRRMITFTDSRQGTARIATKLQQDSERNRIRGAIYQKSLDSIRSLDPARVEAIQRDIDDLKKLPPNAVISRMLEQQVKELENLSKLQPVTYSQVVQWLSATVPDVRDWMHRYYEAMDPAQFSGSSGQERLAKILVMREFARRPKRLNSLETMGLVAVHYPKLNSLVTRPAAVESAGISFDEWKFFLKICLDFHVRENTFIELPDSWRKWGGNRISSKLLLAPVSVERQTNRLKKWPQCARVGRHSRLVRLLSYVLLIDVKLDSGKDRIDSILRAAWDDLVKVNLLQMGGGGRYMSLEDIAFAPISRAWVCPVTRRILDVTFRGVTPYLPSDVATSAVAVCKEVEIPVTELSKSDFPSEEARIRAIRDWADSDKHVQDLRAEGLWSDLNDRIIEGGAYFRAAEHSAQQSGSKLQQYEREFKDGFLNLMSCSTTMEMGVDIGGINMVAMNNVPPHPSNYLQRAGRAGRRGETRSVALTLCKNNPHDQQVFSNTLWAFKTSLPAPSISLSSPVLVQRHINAMLLADFLLREVTSASLEKLNMEWWMLPKGSCRIERFVAWASCFEEKKNVALTQGLNSLLRHTVFEGQQSVERLAVSCADAAKAHAGKWMSEHEAIDAQIQTFGTGKEKDPAYKSLLIQRRRLTDEYLLRDLAGGGFLPGYGFPTDITSFETLTKDEIERTEFEQKRTEGTDKRRVDNLFRRRELPSRDSVTALREYAPGAEIVIDGVVYRSAGITLNWHAPASTQDFNEIQNIRNAWRCRSCGSSGTSVLAELISNCPHCGANFQHDTQSLFKYLEPAGYSVDLYEPTHNDVSTQTYVPVEAPWINATGHWIALPNPALGRFRANSLGTVFHHSAGAHGEGYAVCLECGRAEPILSPIAGAGVQNNTPFAFRTPHRRLRGRQGGDTNLCGGSDKPFAVQNGLRFGSESLTDVLELVLSDPDGKPISDRKTAYTLAVAIRAAVAATLGVEESELGCDTKEIRLHTGEKTFALLVFDRSSSGYSSSVAHLLPSILRRARESLECEHACDAACQHCLLSFDTRFRLDELDRHLALSFLTDKWLDELSLKDADAHFGVGKSFSEHQTLPEAITRELSQATATGLIIYLGGSHSDWDLAGSSLRRWIHRWSLEGKSIFIMLPSDAIPNLSDEDRFTLRVLSEYENTSVHKATLKPLVTGTSKLATVVCTEPPFKSWATSNKSAATPDTGWGDTGLDALVMGYSEIEELTEKVEFGEFSPKSTGDLSTRIDIDSALDGPAAGFGKRLFQELISVLPSGDLPGTSAVKSIYYQDRYLCAPLPVMLLIDFLSAVKAHCLKADRWDVEKIHVITTPVDTSAAAYGPPFKVFHNWSESKLRDDALRSSLEYCGFEVDIQCIDRRDAEHSRCMQIQMADGIEISIWFDQGFGYWTVPRGDFGVERLGLLNYSFYAAVEQQAEALASPRVKVVGQKFPTHLFVSVAKK